MIRNRTRRRRLAVALTTLLGGLALPGCGGTSGTAVTIGNGGQAPGTEGTAASGAGAGAGPMEGRELGPSADPGR